MSAGDSFSKSHHAPYAPSPPSSDRRASYKGWALGDEPHAAAPAPSAPAERWAPPAAASATASAFVAVPVERVGFWPTSPPDAPPYLRTREIFGLGEIDRSGGGALFASVV